jgi:hypothetical protein
MNLALKKAAKAALRKEALAAVAAASKMAAAVTAAVAIVAAAAMAAVATVAVADTEIIIDLTYFALTKSCFTAGLFY